MKLAYRFSLAFKALRELGPSALGTYALYRFGLQSGHYQRQLKASIASLDGLYRGLNLRIHAPLPELPDRHTMLELLGDQVGPLYAQADEIVDGKVRLFGGQPVPLTLTPPGPLSDWTDYERGNSRIDGQDIKLTWEPGRFGWACTLAMAYHLSGDPHYAETFWDDTDRFLTANPAYLGPHWSSAQEVAIRLVALAFSIQVFTQSDQATPERLDRITKAIATHAERIPPTLVYARSQNNNHLITEALGLYTASALLPEHPLASNWHRLGWTWLQYALRTQIDADGTYIQHSANYHRLMLQAALWLYAVHDHAFINEPIPSEIATRLEASTSWLWKLVDPETGCVPNLGHNDGAYILPLSVCLYSDYRPVMHAAVQKFLNTNLTPKGCWNDMSYWLGSPPHPAETEVGLDFWRNSLNSKALIVQPPYILLNPKNSSWATLRVARFHSRPAHADQLHLDLWWHGSNLAQDPGTYLYNAQVPWENSLTSAFVHNTVTLDGQEFMLRAGRFLYLDWAQARIVDHQTLTEGGIATMTAAHIGYRKIGVDHSRQVTAYSDGHWEVIDRLVGPPVPIHTARLHWLLPDWEYEILPSNDSMNDSTYEVRLHAPFGWVSLKMGVNTHHSNNHTMKAVKYQLVRAGKLLHGNGTTSPISGWTSMTYGDKIPALACILEISQSLPIELKSEWNIPSES